MALVLFVLINPFFEELIVRAYVMSEMMNWTKNVALAVIVSVGVQGLYHIYQGLPNAVSVSAGFVVLAIYYGKSRRIVPIILAHLYADVFSIAYYFWRH